MLEYDLGKRFFIKKIISFYKVRNWNIFVEKNVVYVVHVYSKTQIYSKNNLNNL
jgi:hypothetical protein